MQRGTKKKRRQTSRRGALPYETLPRDLSLIRHVTSAAVTARERDWDIAAAKQAAALAFGSPVRVVSGASTMHYQAIVEEEIVEHRRLSARARRRYTNDRLLRELAGPLKARTHTRTREHHSKYANPIFEVHHSGADYTSILPSH